jgi:gas vesicle protein
MSRIYYSEEAEQAAKRQQMMNIITFMLLGLGIGALVALMFAPNEGKKTREKLSDELSDRVGFGSSDDALSRLEKQYNNLRDEVDKLVSSIRG